MKGIGRGALLSWAGVVGMASLAGHAILARDPLGILRPCPLRILTGIPCPTCGGTLALRQISEGRIGPALAANPLIALLALSLLASGAAALLAAPFARRIPLPASPRSRALWLLPLALVLANWVYLILAR